MARAQQARQLKLESGMAGEANRWSPEESVDRREAPDSALEAEDERALLLRRLDRLDDRERTILSLRYGLEGDLPLTLKEIGRRLGVTREWVRKIELRAVRKLDDRARGRPAPQCSASAAPPHGPGRRPSLAGRAADPAATVAAPTAAARFRHLRPGRPEPGGWSRRPGLRRGRVLGGDGIGDRERLHSVFPNPDPGTPIPEIPCTAGASG